MNEVQEQNILSKIRTLLALERNFLAEERTALAEFRTGLALAVLGPSVSTFFAYLLAVFAADQTIVLDLLNFAFFVIVTIYGVWDVLRSRSQLKIIRRKKRTIKKRIIEVSQTSEEVYNLLFNSIREDYASN